MAKKIIAAGGLVTNEKDEILMIFRRGVWDLPKGKLDKGETIETCAIREVEEETGLKNITLGKLLHITTHNYFDMWSLTNVTKETHWFAMKVNGKQKLVPQTEEDILEIKWIKKAEMSEYLKNSYKNIVETIKGFLI